MSIFLIFYFDNNLYNLRLFPVLYKYSNKCVLFKSHYIKNMMEQYSILSLTIFEVLIILLFRITKMLICTSLYEKNYHRNNNLMLGRFLV